MHVLPYPYKLHTAPTSSHCEITPDKYSTVVNVDKYTRTQLTFQVTGSVSEWRYVNRTLLL
jgi:hypothetical protein